MDKQAILNFLLGAVPALWMALGPAVTVIVTGFFNSAIKAHVPRELQIPLAGLINAVAAGLSGSDPTTIGASLAIGSAIQGAFSTNPNTVLAGAKPEAKPAS